MGIFGKNKIKQWRDSNNRSSHSPIGAEPSALVGTLAAGLGGVGVGPHGSGLDLLELNFFAAGHAILDFEGDTVEN